MKNLRNKFAPPTADLVQKYIDSAYDKVKLVADNLSMIEGLGTALENGTFDDLVYIQDIDSYAELNSLVLDENLATEAYVQLQVAGLYDHKGGYDASTNTPDLDTAPTGVKHGDAYTVTAGGNFYAVAVDPGDLLIANQDDPTDASQWTIVNRNIDESGFASAAQGALADTALQPGGVDNVSELINDAGYTDDQTPAEIQIAYSSAVPLATQLEAETGTGVETRRWTPQRVAQAALAQTGKIVFVDGNYVASPSEVLYVDTSLIPIQITLPAGAVGNNVWVIDAGHNAAVNNITIVPNGSDTVDTDPSFIIDQNEGFVRLAFRVSDTDWRVAISGIPELVEPAPHTHVVADITDLNLDLYALADGFKDVNDQTGLTYTFVAADLEEIVVANNAAASTYSIPDSFGSLGSTINLYNKGAGAVTINMAGTDTLNTVDNDCAQYKAVTIVKIGATEWAVIGGTTV